MANEEQIYIEERPDGKYAIGPECFPLANCREPDGFNSVRKEHVPYFFEKMPVTFFSQLFERPGIGGLRTEDCPRGNGAGPQCRLPSSDFPCS
jgi:hypothetical protein